MLNFRYHNPVQIIFGKGSIAELSSLIPRDKKILMLYGGGSIKKNGVYEQVKDALIGHQVEEFSGIEPNPLYETCMKAVKICREDDVDFLLAVGGGSVLDGAKFISAAAMFEGGDPWDILAKKSEVKKALPLGCVLTLPATGSEMNTFSVISRASTQEKLAFGSPLVYPRFSILDPETTYSIPLRYLRNGIVDAFVHVMEQYATYPVGALLQDRQAEAILSTLIEIVPKILDGPPEYNSRANFMWCATQALNGLISCGTVQDWSTHYIGHELTAFFGLDHGQSLAVLHPGVLKFKEKEKREKLAQMSERIFGKKEGGLSEKSAYSIKKIEEFFLSLGMKTKLSDYGINQAGIERVVERFKDWGTILGERKDITYKEIGEILRLRI